ncbi:hypothetical protein CPB84DRAFT_1848660 [Gymnopilus junonius]|uniref:Uncharacterized protein n=1 Tax=Gymnopilus junonius TaxID=109634 RepID=A0A9P5NKK1_GYMJU|nr:hypothetical protein CPB84DRAFT_1848660 [Gymnopilus junonius]
MPLYLKIAYGQSKDSIRVQLLDEWMQRTKGSVVRLHIIKDSEYPSHPYNLINLLRAYSHQWLSIHLQVSTSWLGFFGTTDNVIKLSFPNLCHFSLYGLPPSPAVSLDAAVPALRYLTIGRHLQGSHIMISDERDFFADLKPAFVLPFVQITLLKLSQISFSQQLLGDFPALVEAQLKDIKLLSNDNHGNFIHSTLSKLDVCFWNQNDLRELLSALSLPQLKSLRVEVTVYKSSHFAMDILHPFLRQSHCKVTELVLRYAIRAGDDHDIVEFLETLPYLRELNICDTAIYSDRSFATGLGGFFFNALHPLRNPLYLSSLEVLWYEGPVGLPMEDAIRPAILRSRFTEEDNTCDRECEPTSAMLRKLTISANNMAKKTLSQVSLEAKLLQLLKNLMDLGVFELTDMHGDVYFF